MAIEDITPEVKEDVIDAPEEGADDTIVPPESSPEGDDSPEGDEPEDGEEVITPAPVVIPEAKTEIIVPAGQLKRLPDESDREWALRLENNRLRNLANQGRSKEIVDNRPETVVEAKPSEVLKKYKPEDVAALREVLPELAKEMGYVRKDELNASNYETIANEQIEAFITEHPEYSIEKDPEGTLWNRLKEEYKTLYKPPTNPKDFKKIFERIHRDVFGIEPKGPLPKDNAAREKIKVASSTSTSVPAAPRSTARKAAPGALRLDMLKGFSDEDKSKIEARATEE